jgi:hypothetical protein
MDSWTVDERLIRNELRHLACLMASSAKSAVSRMVKNHGYVEEHISRIFEG